MWAVLFDGQLRVVEDYPKPRLLPGEAIVQPHLAGICATDLEICKGYKGFRGVLGHEFVGVVVECAQKDWLGQRVVGEINIACGQCVMCRQGRKKHCYQRSTLGINGRDGVMAERTALPIENLWRVPDNVDDRAAVFTEPLAAALQILESCHIRPSEFVVIVGDGKLGMLAAQIMRLTGAKVHVVGLQPQRWPCLTRLGISCGEEKEFEARFADVVIECSGCEAGLRTAFGLVRPQGRIVLKSTFYGEVGPNLTGCVVDEVSIIPSRCGPFAPALALLSRGLVDTEALIADVFSLKSAKQAFASAYGRLKILLDL